MAYTEIHSIHSTLRKAIAYIMHPAKTDGGRYVETYGCLPFDANEIAQNFEEVRKMGTNRGNVLAQHMIQSFRPGEVTPEQAMEIGKKTADAFFKGKYQYFISVHLDKEHLHCHIIANNVSFDNFRSFEYQENQNKKAKENLMKISDAICREYGLSVIENPELGKGKSHYEWDMAQQGLSWKAKLKNEIDQALMDSGSFDEFLEEIKRRNVECVYRPENVISLKFRMSGQQRFCRARTLGWYYEEKQIRKRIENYTLLKTGRPSTPQKSHLIDTTSERFQQAKGLERWAEIQNMKEASKILNFLAEHGMEDQAELEKQSVSAYGDRVQLVGNLNRLQRQIDAVSDTIKLVKKYMKYKPYQEAYNQATFKKKYAKDNAYELQQFADAKNALMQQFPDRKIPSLERLQKDRDKLIAQRNEENGKYRQVVAELKELDYARTTIEEYLRSQQQTQQRQKKKDDGLY